MCIAWPLCFLTKTIMAFADTSQFTRGLDVIFFLTSLLAFNKKYNSSQILIYELCPELRHFEYLKDRLRDSDILRVDLTTHP